MSAAELVTPPSECNRITTAGRGLQRDRGEHPGGLIAAYVWDFGEGMQSAPLGEPLSLDGTESEERRVLGGERSQFM